MNQRAVDALSPLAADVKTEDPDRYLSTLFAPPDYRDSLFALYAFDHEIARVRRVVREPMAGLIRLQWWRDVIDDFEQKDAIGHPVIRNLHHAVFEGGVDREYLRRAIEGRRRSFELDEPPDLAAYEAYLLDIGGSVTRAAAQLLGATDHTAQAAASRVGLVCAALEQLRTLQPTGPDQQAWLSSHWLDGLKPEFDRLDVSKGKPIEARLADWALAQLAEARREAPSIARALLPAFFPGTLAGYRLSGFARSLPQSPIAATPLRLLWAWMRRRF